MPAVKTTDSHIRQAGIKKAIEQKSAAFQKLNGNVGEQRCILTITKWFIGKLKPNYCEKVPLENKQFALFLCLDSEKQLWPSSTFALYPQSIAL